MNNWIVITAKFEGTCYVCGCTINKGDTIYWKKQEGVKHHPQCPSMLKPDDSRLIIIPADDDFYLKDSATSEKSGDESD